MLQKSYSEGIFLEKTGPQLLTNYRSTDHINNERSYCTSVYFVPKLIPKRAYLTVKGAPEEAETIATRALATYNRKCSLSNGSVKSYESSVSIDQKETIDRNGLDSIDGLKCFQNIELVPGLVMKDFSETVNIFPTTYNKSYRSNVSYDECYTKRNYIAGLEVQKTRQVELLSIEGKESSFTSSVYISPDNTSNKVNGECEDLL